MVLVSVPSQTYAATTGTPRKVVYPQPLDPAVRQIHLHLTRENWPDANPLAIMGFDYSLDGSNWISHGSAPLLGGVILDRNGQPALESVLYVTLPSVGVVGRRLRASVENFLDLTTAITVEAF